MELYRPAFEFQTHAIEIDTWIGKLMLTPVDTLVVLFRQPQSKQFESVEHIITDMDAIDPQYVAQLGHVYGFIPTEDLKQWLQDNDFPTLVRPVCDQLTYDWYVSLQEQDLMTAPAELHVEDIVDG